MRLRNMKAADTLSLVFISEQCAELSVAYVSCLRLPIRGLSSRLQFMSLMCTHSTSRPSYTQSVITVSDI